MAKRIKIGDVFQIVTINGIAYAQVTHKHERYGYLVRVFAGFHDKQVSDFAKVVSEKPLFSAFFLIQAAVNQGFFTVIANCDVSDANKIFPHFRSTSYGKNGERGDWWIWNGTVDVRLFRPLTDEEKKYSIHSIISAPLLIERTQNQYRAEVDDV
jgi:hypothetical protein